MQMDVWKIGQSAFDYCGGPNDAASYSFFYQFRLIVLACAMKTVIGMSTEGILPCVTRSVGSSFLRMGSLPMQLS